MKRNSARIITSVTAVALLFGVSTVAFADTYSDSNSNGEENSNTTGKVFDAQLLGGNEVPTVSTSTTSGYSGVWFGPQGQGMNYWLDVYNGDEVKAAHLHCASSGANGPVVASLFDDSNGTDVNGRLAEGDISTGDIADSASDCSNTIGYDIENLADLSKAIEEGKIYVNVHSEQYPNGVTRGQLAFRENTTDGDTGSDTDDGYNNDKDHGNKDWMSDWNNHWDNNSDWDNNKDWKNDDCNESWNDEHDWNKNIDWDNNRGWNKDNTKNWDRDSNDENWYNNKDWNDDANGDDEDWEKDWNSSNNHPIRTITNNLELRTSGEW